MLAVTVYLGTVGILSRPTIFLATISPSACFIHLTFGQSCRFIKLTQDSLNLAT
ncbi:hypothetical protein [Shewanella baltica]|uniref:hypothetical protein n=1 Tax=Shewanella baltica TaxID=62322 RepID=UPI00217F1F89|nr:hypothetical protein [Shewanella baltica]